MGPHSFKCGSIVTISLEQHQPFRFNGAALFQVRKSALETKLIGTIMGFNGAALFQVRKFGWVGGKRWVAKIASMGPHSFKCGSGSLSSDLLITS